MAVKLRSLRADLNKEQEGDWVALPEIPGVRVRVRSTNYRQFVVDRDAASRRLARQYGDKPVPEEESAKINGELAVKHLLLDWDGFDEKYSRDVADEVLKDPGYRELRGSVYWAATQVGRAQIEFTEEAVKNSEPASATD